MINVRSILVERYNLLDEDISELFVRSIEAELEEFGINNEEIYWSLYQPAAMTEDSGYLPAVVPQVIKSDRDIGSSQWN